MEDKRNPPRPTPKPKPRSKGPEQQEKVLDRDEIAKALDVVEEGGKFPKLFSATTRKKKKEEILAAFAALLVEANRGTLDDAMIIQRLREERNKYLELNEVLEGYHQSDTTRLALADALIPFTSHKIPCPFVTLLEDYKGKHYKCTCGLDETVVAYRKGEKPERCECGADAEACKLNREKFGVHLESGCGN